MADPGNAFVQPLMNLEEFVQSSGGDNKRNRVKTIDTQLQEYHDELQHAPTLQKQIVLLTDLQATCENYLKQKLINSDRKRGVRNLLRDIDLDKQALIQQRDRGEESRMITENIRGRTRHIEGYFYSPLSPIDTRFYPEKPVEHRQPWQGQTEWLEELKSVEAHVRENNASSGGQEGLKNANIYVTYGEEAPCRLCEGKPSIGLNEFQVYRGDDVWIWPGGDEQKAGGLRHYIEVHNVKPSDEFLKFIETFDYAPNTPLQTKV
jgi:hypothetical protein